MTKITCPRCGEEITINSSGRKRIEVPVINIYDALRISKNGDGTANYSMAATALGKRTGIRVSRGFIHARVGSMAEERGITRAELVAEIINGTGEV